MDEWTENSSKMNKKFISVKEMYEEYLREDLENPMTYEEYLHDKIEFFFGTEL